MALSERYNQSLMKAIKRMHTLVESDDLDRVRASQENISKRHPVYAAAS